MSKDHHIRSIPKKKSEETESGTANSNTLKDASRNVCTSSFNCCSARSFVQLDDHRGSTDSIAKREHWIKTDADCKLCSQVLLLIRKKKIGENSVINPCLIRLITRRIITR
jgi:hypothetical protein